jgi:hypothetical protein
LERMNVGIVMHEFIQKDIIPQLKKMMKKARTDNEIAKFEELITEYEKYSDGKSQESRTYSKTVAAIVKTLGGRYRQNEADMEELMQTLAEDFFEPLRDGGKNLMQKMESSFRIMEGPVALNRLWASVVQAHVTWRIRMRGLHNREQLMEPKVNDEGQELNPMDNVPAEKDIDIGYVRDLMKDLTKYIHQKFKNPKFVEMFDLWWGAVQDKGMDRVNLDKDVFTPLRDKGYEGKPSAMSEQLIGIKREVFQFFKKELEGESQEAIRKILKLKAASVTERVACIEFRKRIARWMLGGMMSDMIKAETR